MSNLTLLYRRIFTGGLLLLYLFIATPVQLWHHHTELNNVVSGKKMIKPSGNSQSDICKICQHTYAVYVNDCAHFNLGSLHAATLLDSSFRCQIPESFPEKASNKGPPCYTAC